MNEQTDSLKIKELQLSDLASNAAIIVIAKRGSGKTFLCRTLIDHYIDIPVGIIVSYTEDLDPFYKNFFPDAFIYNKNSQHVFHKILDRQRKIKKKAQQYYEKTGKRIDTRLLLLMDDCLSDSKGWGKNEDLREILFNGRHYDITYILTMQAPLEISPALRDNFDYIFLFTTDIWNDQKRIYVHYAGMFPTFQAFREVYTELTENYGTMVIKRRGVKGKLLSDKIFHFKAKLHIPPMFGCSYFKKFHDKNYDKNWLENNTLNKIDPMSYNYRKKYNIPKIEKIDNNGHIKFD